MLAASFKWFLQICLIDKPTKYKCKSWCTPMDPTRQHLKEQFGINRQSYGKCLENQPVIRIVIGFQSRLDRIGTKFESDRLDQLNPTEKSSVGRTGHMIPATAQSKISRKSTFVRVGLLYPVVFDICLYYRIPVSCTIIYLYPCRARAILNAIRKGVLLVGVLLRCSTASHT